MEDLRKLLTAGRVVEIEYHGEKRVGVVSFHKDKITTFIGDHYIERYRENLTFINDEDYIAKIYENTPDGLKLIWDRKDFVDWSKVPVDTKVLIKGYCGDWLNRYFAKYENGKIYTWDCGATSWSATSNKAISEWDEVKLAKQYITPIK